MYSFIIIFYSEFLMRDVVSVHPINNIQAEIFHLLAVANSHANGSNGSSATHLQVYQHLCRNQSFYENLFWLRIQFSINSLDSKSDCYLILGTGGNIHLRDSLVYSLRIVSAIYNVYAYIYFYMCIPQSELYHRLSIKIPPPPATLTHYPC